MSYAKDLGMVRVWQDGEVWRWVPVGEWAPENSVVAKRLWAEGEEVIYIERGHSGEFIRGAVKGG